ncbi:MAG: SLC13 family permease, partial [Planctomycetota bacterium]
MNSLVIVAYVAVYISMLLGGIPGFRVDRTGAALLGAILMLVLGGITEAQALQSVDVPTLALLFGMMVVSAQFQLGGLYGYAAKHAV